PQVGRHPLERADQTAHTSPKRQRGKDFRLSLAGASGSDPQSGTCVFSARSWGEATYQSGPNGPARRCHAPGARLPTFPAGPTAGQALLPVSWSYHLDRPDLQERLQKVGGSPILHDAAVNDSVDVDSGDFDHFTCWPHPEPRALMSTSCRDPGDYPLPLGN